MVSGGLLVVLLAATLTSTMILRNLVRDQNRQLLHDRTAEAGLVLTSSLVSVKPTLQVLAASYVADPDRLVARTLTGGYAGATGGATAIVERENQRFVARIAAGPGIAAKQALTGARAALVRRSITAKDLVSDVFLQRGGRRPTIAFAFALPNGVVAYEELGVDPAQLTKSSENSSFGELQGALYAAPTAQASKLLFSTSAHLPPPGHVTKQLLHIGADRWLLEASARRSLVGSFASTAPWIVFALGLLVSLAAFAAAEVLLRRRAYALALVDERTTILRQTLSDLESARASAEAANQAKSEFLSRMSHELRTPLNAVLGFAQVLEIGDLTDAQRLAVTQITKGGQHLLELINDVLDISRIETGNLALSAEPVLVDDVVEDVLDLVEPLAAQRDVRCIAGAGEGNSSYVLADRQRLKQVLLNLLSNAIKYNRPGGTVTVTRERRSDGRLRISVTDTGRGIPAEQRDRLFEPFERLGAEQSDIEGTGVGLALSRRLAEAMDGTLDIDDSVGGEGTTFWIELWMTEGPLEHHRRTTRGTSFATPDALPGGRQHTVLYIEDNVANIKLIEQIFDDWRDVHLITAMQGRLGIELALQHHPELILLDLHLPDIDGETVLAELRTHAETSTVPIIILTADATERQRERLTAAGATAYMTKPIDVRELLELAVRSFPTAPVVPQPSHSTLTRQT
jgi:signal transduction histidine kinase/ActR/RegA family two-component response regulator